MANDSKTSLIIEGYNMLFMGNNDHRMQLLGKMIDKHPDSFLEFMGLSDDNLFMKDLMDLIDTGEKIKATKAVSEHFNISLKEAKLKVEEIIENL